MEVSKVKDFIIPPVNPLLKLVLLFLTTVLLEQVVAMVMYLLRKELGQMVVEPSKKVSLTVTPFFGKVAFCSNCCCR